MADASRKQFSNAPHGVHPWWDLIYTSGAQNAAVKGSKIHEVMLPNAVGGVCAAFAAHHRRLVIAVAGALSSDEGWHLQQIPKQGKVDANA